MPSRFARCQSILLCSSCSSSQKSALAARCRPTHPSRGTPRNKPRVAPHVKRYALGRRRNFCAPTRPQQEAESILLPDMSNTSSSLRSAVCTHQAAPPDHLRFCFRGLHSPLPPRSRTVQVLFSTALLPCFSPLFPPRITRRSKRTPAGYAVSRPLPQR